MRTLLYHIFMIICREAHQEPEHHFSMCCFLLDITQNYSISLFLLILFFFENFGVNMKCPSNQSTNHVQVSEPIGSLCMIVVLAPRVIRCCCFIIGPPSTNQKNDNANEEDICPPKKETVTVEGIL